MSDDFYIGYLDHCPTTLARPLRWMIGAMALAVVLISALVAWRQAPADSGSFEFGVVRAFEGVLYESPLPLLHTMGPDGVITNYLLVGRGKRGFLSPASGLSGKRVQLTGTLIQKDSQRMIEVQDVRLKDAVEGPPSGTAFGRRSVGEMVLEGELVDTKCYLGVMRPAVGKVHRGCAVRCLSGGVPPGLLIRDGQGGAVVVLLVGSRGGPLNVDPQWAARIVEVRGELFIAEGMMQLEVSRLTLH